MDMVHQITTWLGRPAPPMPDIPSAEGELEEIRRAAAENERRVAYLRAQDALWALGVRRRGRGA